MRKWGWLGIIFVLCMQTAAAALDVRPGAPAVYTVQPGDTLIGIASRYLQDPSDWPLIMQNNPQVRSPDLLYPGEVLTLK
ncbi:MAG: LysM peptidoglycan-binding domain-containing protein, partial [Gammaproteobacteria bacterium]